MNHAINVGLIGFGLAGRVFHGPVLRSVPGFVIRSIYTTSPQNIEMAKEKHPDANIVTDAQAIFSDEAVDLVVVATPNSSHYDLAAAAIEAGKHIIVDKPFMITSQDADRIIEKAERKGVCLSVFQNRRWDSDFLTVKKIVREGLAGDLLEFENRLDRYAPIAKQAWRYDDIPGSGMLYDLGAHLIDQVMDLFGNPSAVTADVRKQRRGAKAADSFEVLLHYENGLKAVAQSSMMARIPTPRFTVVGQNGVFAKYGFDIQEDVLKTGALPAETGSWGTEPSAYHGHLCATVGGVDFDGRIVSEQGDYRKYYENILAVLQGKEELIVTPRQARNVIRVIEYAAQSSEKGVTVACDGLV